VSAALERALVESLAKAGVEVIEARISHLAYSPEIAAAMLQRQQASADNITQASRQATIAANGFNLLPLMRGNQPRDIR
jgi:regulator of protease activity HflC (stomatin/prohibitin superfamily)